MEKKYSVSEKDLVYLIRSTEKWHALESAGVDNWEWYDFAFEDYYETNNLNEEELEEETNEELISRYFKKVNK